MRWSLSLILLLLAWPVLADLKITGDDRVAPYRAVRLVIEDGPADAAYIWDVTPEDLIDVVVEENGAFKFVAPPGVYRIKVRSVVAGDKGRIKIDSGRKTVTVGNPDPLPPVPPDPPGPKPPTPGPVPIPGINGLAVLIVYESADALPAAQQAAVYSKTVRDYLKSKCAPDPSVATWTAFRMYDKDVDLSAENKAWKDAMARKRESLPWIIVSNPTRGGGFEGPLPKDAAALMELLKKWGD